MSTFRPAPNEYDNLMPNERAVIKLVCLMYIVGNVVRSMLLWYLLKGELAETETFNRPLRKLLFAEKSGYYYCSMSVTYFIWWQESA